MLRGIVNSSSFLKSKISSLCLFKYPEYCDSIIICNDGSDDLTGNIASDLGAIVVNHKKNLGYGAGINSIFHKAKEIGSEILITFDADGQHRIEDIDKVIKPISDGQSDIVIGSRFLDDSEKEIPNYNLKS